MHVWACQCTGIATVLSLHCGCVLGKTVCLSTHPVRVPAAAHPSICCRAPQEAQARQLSSSSSSTRPGATAAPRLWLQQSQATQGCCTPSSNSPHKQLACEAYRQQQQQPLAAAAVLQQQPPYRSSHGRAGGPRLGLCVYSPCRGSWPANRCTAVFLQHLLWAADGMGHNGQPAGEAWHLGS
jgi:hypothetical protein